MKNYILFAYSILGIGGGQQYYKNRIQYLVSKGFNVHLYSAFAGTIQIDILKKYNSGIIPELNYLPSGIGKGRRESVLDCIVGKIDPADEVYVESVGGYLTLWAELAAQKLCCKHICFNIAEFHAVKPSPQVIDFYYFKYKRNELYGIKADSLHILFKDRYDVPVSKDLAFSASCLDVVDQNGEFKQDFPPADFTIGGIWRTNKPGFLPTMERLFDFVQSNNDYKFNVVIIGSGSSENEKLVKKQFSKAENTNLILLGYVYPIPSELLKKIDVFVSTAGSARVPMYCGKPTISVTTDEKGQFYPLGIFNYTTLNTTTPEETVYTLPDYLRMVLYEDYCRNHPVISDARLTLYSVDKKNDSQMSKLYLDNAKEYYDVLGIKPENLKDKINYFFCKTVGAGLTAKINPFLRKLRIILHKGE